MKEIKKPTILQLKETEDAIVNIINSSGLPAFILRRFVDKILRQLEELEQRELIEETARYNKMIEETNEKEENE